MNMLRLTSLAAVLLAMLAACAQAPLDHAAHHPASAAPATQAKPDHAAHMDSHMKAMRDMHDKMARATPQERESLMADHMKLMQDGMAMMDGMKGMGMGRETGMGDMPAGPPGAADIAARQDQMAKRMEMMHSMMQMMMDRMVPPASKP
jgi:hypothetical protein